MTLGLVAIVVFLFLQNLQSTLIPILAIPVSIFGTFCFFIPLGFTINTLTMFGFVLAIGIVVDDAIIVVEAVQHYIDHDKMSAKEATYQAMKDISAPVVAIALILAAVFVPVGFIPGIVGRLVSAICHYHRYFGNYLGFYRPVVNAGACTLLLKPTDESKKNKGLTKWFTKFNDWFDRVTAKYTEGVNSSIKGCKVYCYSAGLCLCRRLFSVQDKAIGLYSV